MHYYKIFQSLKNSKNRVFRLKRYMIFMIESIGLSDLQEILAFCEPISANIVIISSFPNKLFSVFV